VSAPPDGEALRAIVREVLADLLPSLTAGNVTAPATSGATPATSNGATAIAGGGATPATAGGCVHAGGNGASHAAGGPPAYTAPPQAGVPAYTVREHTPTVETVSLRSDADLMAFVRRLLHLFENPRQREALRTGRLAFRLAAATGPGSVQPSHRVEKGAVTEAMVTAAARAGARLVLGRGAVLTPLARDRARAAGVDISRER
jgi:hypothetical protein